MRPVPSSIAQRLMPAAEIIADRGLDQTKIEDVTAATGIPKATLYYYFASKEEILAFLFRDTLRLMSDAVTIVADSPGTARERLGRMVHAQLEVMAAHPAVCRALIADLGRAARIPEVWEAVAEAYSTPVQRVIDAGAADGSLRSVDSAEASITVFGAVTISGLAHLVATGRLPAAHVAGQVTSLLLSGLAAAPPDPAARGDAGAAALPAGNPRPRHKQRDPRD